MDKKSEQTIQSNQFDGTFPRIKIDSASQEQTTLKSGLFRQKHFCKSLAKE